MLDVQEWPANHSGFIPLKYSIEWVAGKSILTLG